MITLQGVSTQNHVQPHNPIQPSKLVNSVMHELFRQFAENPMKLGRHMLWIETACGRTFPAENKYFSITRCGVIHDVMLNALFGFKKAMEPLIAEEVNEDTLKKAWSIIRDNAQILTPSLFFTYSFTFNNRTNTSGHVFLITQSLNNEGQVEYTIVQSYLGKYCLKSSFKDKPLNEEAFTSFSHDLQACVLSEFWTVATEAFYAKYIKVPNLVRLQRPNPCYKNIESKYALGSIHDIEGQREQFISFSKSFSFPDIEPIDCACCTKPAIPNLQVEKTNTRLHEIYDQIDPVSDLDHLQINLEDLDLDLSEECLILLPMRDESGNLFIVDSEVEWSMQAITMKKVVQHVIQELNKTLRNSQMKDSVLLNTNKSPMQDYVKLGLPEDQFFILEGDQEKLWLDRIIEAFKNRGYVKKLLTVNGHGFHIQL